MSWQERSKVERICAWCQQPFLTPTKGKHTARFCTRSCAAHATNQMPQVKEAVGAINRKPLVSKICAHCGHLFQFKGINANATRRFCSKTCSNTWKARRMEERERSRQLIKRTHAAHVGRKNPDTAQRMRHSNPMLNPASVAKMRQKLIGRTFLARGGNGAPTLPQMALAQALQLPIEYPILTASVKGLFPSLPPCYKVDVGDPEHKIAIEVDGRTHREKRWKFLDQRKTSILQALGWSVLRFSNQQVMQELPLVVAEIQQYITSKSQATTTT